MKVGQVFKRLVEPLLILEGGVPRGFPYPANVPARRSVMCLLRTAPGQLAAILSVLSQSRIDAGGKR